MREELLRRIGTIKNSKLARGGDIFIYPRDKIQPEAILEITTLNNKPVKNPYPMTLSQNVGIITRVEAHYSEEQLSWILARFNVTKA